jgi:hypothetical protein
MKHFMFICKITHAVLGYPAIFPTAGMFTAILAAARYAGPSSQLCRTTGDKLKVVLYIHSCSGFVSCDFPYFHNIFFKLPSRF